MEYLLKIATCAGQGRYMHLLGGGLTLVATWRASLGRLYFDARNFNAARTEFQAALLSFEELGDKRGQANALLHLGKIDFATGKDPVAQAAKLFRESGDSEGEKQAREILFRVQIKRSEVSGKVKDKPA
jgi:hypothetical protein